MAALEERFVPIGVADLDAHGFVPAIGHATKLRIERRPHFRDHLAQRRRQVFVLAAPEPVPSHHYPAAELAVVRIEYRKRAAFLYRKQSLQDRAALRVEIAACLHPVDRIDARGDVGGRGGMDEVFRGCFHGRYFRKSTGLTPPDSREVYTVIASAAKQSMAAIPKAGLLRRWRSSP